MVRGFQLRMLRLRSSVDNVGNSFPAKLAGAGGVKRSPVYGVVESGAARLMRMRTSLELLIEKADGVLGAVIATKSARWTSSR